MFTKFAFLYLAFSLLTETGVRAANGRDPGRASPLLMSITPSSVTPIHQEDTNENNEGAPAVDDADKGLQCPQQLRTFTKLGQKDIANIIQAYPKNDDDTRSGFPKKGRALPSPQRRTLSSVTSFDQEDTNTNPQRLPDPELKQANRLVQAGPSDRTNDGNDNHFRNAENAVLNPNPSPDKVDPMIEDVKTFVVLRALKKEAPPSSDTTARNKDNEKITETVSLDNVTEKKSEDVKKGACTIL